MKTVGNEFPRQVVRFTRHGLSALLRAIILLCGSVAFSQTGQPSTADPSSVVVLRQTVRRVAVDVVVDGLDPKASAGLSLNNFTVYENGTPQRIASFERRDAATSTYRPPLLPVLPANIFVDAPKAPERGPLNLILYDALDSDMQDQMFGRLQIVKYIKSAPAGTRFALFVIYRDLRLIQGVTSDKEEVLAALNGRDLWPKLSTNLGDSVNALIELANFAAGIPGRKNIIWLSDAFPSLTSSLGQGGPPGINSTQQSDSNTPERVKQVINVLARNQMALYPIDLRGPIGGLIPMLQHMDEDDLAQSTGGRAAYERNDISTAIAESVEHGSTYYTLTYAPTNTRYDGKLRKIEVKLDKPGFQLSYRRGYFADDPDAPPKALDQPSPDTVHAKMRHGEPMDHDLLFSVRVDPEAAPAPQRTKAGAEKGAHYRLRYVVPIDQLAQQPPTQAAQPEQAGQPVQPDQSAPAQSALQASAMLELAVAVYDKDGTLLHGDVSPAAREPRPANAPPKDNYIFDQSIDLPASAAYLRIGVHEPRSDKMGSLEITLPIPTAATPARTAKPSR